MVHQARRSLSVAGDLTVGELLDVTDPIGRSDSTPRQDSNHSATSPAGAERGHGRGALIFCGMCGALNPATNHFCAACGTTMVDAFHATEGLRVYERPDSASRLIEIVSAGTELEIVEDAAAPEDFPRVRLPNGRLGYIRLQEVAALADTSRPRESDRPDINTNARGCVTPTAALGALALAVVIATLLLVIIVRANLYDQGTLGLFFCVAVAPLLILTIGLYLYARSREDRLEEESDDEAERPAG